MLAMGNENSKSKSSLVLNVYRSFTYTEVSFERD